jgi:hypothetical protein
VGRAYTTAGARRQPGRDSTICPSLEEECDGMKRINELADLVLTLIQIAEGLLRLMAPLLC